MRAANTVEAVIEILEPRSKSNAFWHHVEELIAQRVLTKLERVDKVEVRLFAMSGRRLGERA